MNPHCFKTLVTVCLFLQKKEGEGVHGMECCVVLMLVETEFELLSVFSYLCQN